MYLWLIERWQKIGNPTPDRVLEIGDDIAIPRNNHDFREAIVAPSKS